MKTQATLMSEAELENELQPVIEGAGAVSIITTNEQYIQASQSLSLIAQARKKVEAYWAPMIEKAFALHRELTGKRKQFTDRLDAVDRQTRGALKVYDDEGERIRQETERRERERARAEEDRIRKDKEEQERAWRKKEEAARAEQAKQEEAAKKAKSEKARKEAEEAAANAKADAEKASEKAEERSEQAAQAHVPMPVIPPSIPKVDGTKKVTRWYAKVIDKVLVPEVFKTIDQGALNRYAQTTKGEIKTAGVEFYSETSIERTGR